MPSVPGLRAPIEVYVQLLGEGVTVYRPTTGVPFGTDAVKLLATENFDASDEDWESPPGQ